ncbi:MAG: PAS domain S-box protein, partial [Methylobacter sp.]
MKVWQLWLFSVILSVLLTEAIVAVMGLLLKGEVPFDYLLTGLVASCFVASLVVAMLGYFLERLTESQLQLHAIIEAEPECVKLLDADGKLLQMNRAGLNMIEADSPDQIIGQNMLQLVMPEYRNAFIALAKCVFKGESGNLEFELQGLKGSRRWLDTHAVPLRNSRGQITALLAVTRDITESRVSGTARQEALDRLQKIASRVPGVVFQFQMRPDGSSCFPFASEHIRDIYRVSPEEVREDASKVYAIIHPDDYDSTVASIQASGRDLTPWHHEYRVKFDDGTVRWLFGNSLPQREADGSVLWHGFITDITERKQAETDLRIASTAFESQEATIITDKNQVILRVNQAFVRVTGYSVEEAIGKTPALLKSGRQDAQFYRAMWESLSQDGHWQGEIWNRRKDGEVYPEWLSITAVTDEDGQVTNYVASFSDITERKTAENEIQNLAFYDPLTQLPNRRLLQERLKHGIDVVRREGKQLALLMLDLDRFKAVNDSLGHQAGDVLLQQVAERITGRLRDVDMVARLGGDEFIVLLEDI